MHLLRKLTVILLSLISTAVFAETTNYFSLTIYNSTQADFQMVGIYGANPTNTCKLIPDTILPGKTAELNCQSSNQYDLSGIIQFKNLQGEQSDLALLMRRKFHMGQAILNLRNAKFVSHIIQMHINAESKPLSLQYDYAKISFLNAAY